MQNYVVLLETCSTISKCHTTVGCGLPFSISVHGYTFIFRLAVKATVAFRMEEFALTQEWRQKLRQKEKSYEWGEALFQQY